MADTEPKIVLVTGASSDIGKVCADHLAAHGYRVLGTQRRVDTCIAEATAQLENNVFGVLRVCRAALPVMSRQGSGHIINISSLAKRRRSSPASRTSPID